MANEVRESRGERRSFNSIVVFAMCVVIDFPHIDDKAAVAAAVVAAAVQTENAST